MFFRQKLDACNSYSHTASKVLKVQWYQFAVLPQIHRILLIQPS
uniref:Uncharacterized protein n=1 Tax=Arundo donax TaxID=35708 RepID=A0A0A8XP10_ARUDO